MGIIKKTTKYINGNDKIKVPCQIIYGDHQKNNEVHQW